MRILLLLTVDPALEREVEHLADTLGSPSTLIPLDSPGRVEDTLRTLDGSALLVVDAECFPPPAETPVPVLMVGSAGVEPQGPAPFLERPLRASEFRSLTEWLFSGGGSASGGGSGDASRFLPPAFSGFQRDVVHDLNNQFTTLQGNLILMQEESDDPAVADMVRATTHAARLISYLEWMGEGEFPAETIPVGQFLDHLLPLFHRLRGRRTRIQFEISGATDPVVHTDPSRLMGILVGLMFSIPGTPDTLSLDLRVTPRGGATLVGTWPSAGDWELSPPAVTAWTARIGGRLTLLPSSWELHLPTV